MGRYELDCNAHDASLEVVFIRHIVAYKRRYKGA